MTNLQNLTVQNPVTQNTPATAGNQLVTLAQMQALLAALFVGTWSKTTTYGQGVVCSSGNALWQSLVAGNLGNSPATSPAATGKRACGYEGHWRVGFDTEWSVPVLGGGQEGLGVCGAVCGGAGLDLAEGGRVGVCHGRQRRQWNLCHVKENTARGSGSASFAAIGAR